MRSRFTTMTICLVSLACSAWWTSAPAQGQATLTLENGRLDLSLDRSTGTLVAIQNKLAGETYQVRDDLFEVEAVEFRVGLADAKLTSLERKEPVYFGVYRRGAGDDDKKGAPFRQPGDTAAPSHAERVEDLPLQSESSAMVAMTSAILGPPRFGLVPMACGWHSEMVTGAYTEQSVEGDIKSLDLLAQCGIDWLSDSHPWGGETEKMNALGENDRYEPGPLVRKFLHHARKVGVKVVMWSSMNKTHAWSAQGRPFRSDKPEWLIDAGANPPKNAPEWRRQASGTLSAGGNCLANRAFFNWLKRINLEGMAAGQYKSWAMDGDFFGGGGWYTTVVPVDCQSDKHDHLPGDSNYACQRALAQLTASVREHFPDTYIFMCRPPMDLGIWSLRNVNAGFTLLESGTGKNLAAGDQIRTWSRVRLHRDFFPHYLDQPLLFPSRAGGAGRPSTWPSENIDYIMLSALSSSPNQLYYMPTKSGVPEQDKAEIHPRASPTRRSPQRASPLRGETHA